MANSPPGVKRMVSVLNFFAEHPGQAFTFTDIVRALKLGRATCHALLTGLVDEGYLYRNPDKTYVIGPTLVELGNVVTKQFSPLQAVQPELRKLADDFGVLASAIARDGAEVVIRAKAGSGNSFAWANSPIGERLPLRVPFAATYFAGSDQKGLERWLDVAGESATREQLDLMYECIRFIREKGFAYLTRNRQLPEDSDHRRHFRWSNPDSGMPAYLMTELAPGKSYELSAVLSPVFAGARLLSVRAYRVH